MLMRVPPYSMAQFLARIVMPRSRSMSLESMMRSPRRSWAAKVPDCLSRQSTRVVLPWSTCAMMAMLRIGRFMSVRRRLRSRDGRLAAGGGEKRGAKGSRSARRMPPGRSAAARGDSAAAYPDAQSPHRHTHLDEEGDEGGAQAHHRPNEQQRDHDAQ